MIIYYRYSENKFEKPEKCGYSANFNQKVAEKPCACKPPLPHLTKRHLRTLAWGKRYFGFERCAPPGHLKMHAAGPKELRDHYRKQCCKK